MTRADLQKLIGIDKRRSLAIAMLRRVSAAPVCGLKLTGEVILITDPDVTQFVRAALLQHLEDKIDTLTLAMAELGVETGDTTDGDIDG